MIHRRLRAAMAATNPRRSLDVGSPTGAVTEWKATLVSFTAMGKYKSSGRRRHNLLAGPNMGPQPGLWGHAV